MYLSPVFKVGVFHGQEPSGAFSRLVRRALPACTYDPPPLQVKEGDINDLLHEAEVASRRINGEKIEDIEQQMEEQVGRHTSTCFQGRDGLKKASLSLFSLTTFASL